MKKSQVTLFIIIGLILLISFALILYIKSKVVQKDLVPRLDVVSEDYYDVQNFIRGCVEEVSKEALIKVGAHGGYIDPFDTEMTRKSFDISPISTQSDILYINDDYAVPYWWYLKTNFNCVRCEVSLEQIPGILYIQDQVNRYIEKHMADCLADLEDFTESGYEIEILDSLTARTIFQNEDVLVYVHYPMTISKGSSSTTMENFPVTVDLAFLDIYALALSITQAEQDNQFLETILMHLISAYSDLDTEKLPPIAAFNEGFDTVFWSKTLTKQRLKDLLKSYIPFIQLQNTHGYQQILDPTYNVFTLFANATFTDTSVNFAYFDWPIYLDITPNSGDLLEPSSYQREFPFDIAPTIQTNHYEFFYDVAFPVLAEMRDHSAFGGKGYSFVIALEGNVIDNKNMALWHAGYGSYGPLNYNKVTYGMGGGFEAPDIPVYVPETGNIVNKSFEVPKKKLFCDYNQRLSGEINIEILDSQTLDPVQGADIFFGCGKYSKCNIGETNSNGKYLGKFPVCVGEGHITIEKPGFGPFARSSITIRPDDKLRYRFKLDRFRNVAATISTIHVSNLSGYVSAGEARQIRTQSDDLQRGEEVMFTISKIKDDPFEPSYTQIFSLVQNDSFNILMVEGKYTIFGNVIDSKGIFIPKHTESAGGQSIEVPDINMSIAPLGGVVVGEASPWIVNSKHLDMPYVDFYLFKINPPKKLQDLDDIDLHESYSVKYRNVINPVFRPR